ncbi:MAG TPA: methyl-accepting chemotaxis protein [Spirochaetota bacterium]|nr:methyl-accepting chemotaxis protein [Spirochaetota bacterium]HPV43066.1 methyl-accepting chemotaxis protein [Spirochaetota bacterium]
MFKRFNHFILYKFDDSDYLTRKKASLVMFFALFLIVLLNIGAAASFTVSLERALQFYGAAIPASLFSLLTLVFLRRGKLQVAANIFVILTSGVVFVMFLAKKPEVAYVSLSYFMFVCILFAAVFSSRIVTTLIFIFFVAADLAMFIMNKDIVDAALVPMIKTGLIDSLAALTIAYLIAMLSITVLENSIRIIKDEKVKNDEQFKKLFDIHTIIKGSSNQLKKVAADMRQTTASFSGNIEEQASTISGIAATATGISGGIAQVSSSTADQYDSFVTLIDSINSLAVEIDVLKASSEEITNLFTSVIAIVKNSEGAITLIDRNSNELLESSRKLSSVMEILGEIFDKIQLLALNASIEAARAGEHGKGFAVVAHEVNKLSDQSVGSLKEITDLIQYNNQMSTESMNSVASTVTMLKEIVGIVNTVQEKSRDIFRHINSQEQIKVDIQEKVDIVQKKSIDIKNAARTQDTDMNEITRNLGSISTLIQSNIDAARGLSSTAEKLSLMADELSELIGGSENMNQVIA